MWWIYLVVIALVVVAAIAGFFVGNFITNKKRDEIMKNLTPSFEEQPKPAPEESTVIEPQVQENTLENFSLSENKKSSEKHDINPFSSGDEDEFDDFGDELSDDYVDEKFNEYEEFLRKNTNYFDNDELGDLDEFEEPDEFKEVSKFDFTSLAKKSDEEIAETLKNLSPKAQEMILTEILARRKYEED